jgi:hypothetical protein
LATTLQRQQQQLNKLKAELANLKKQRSIAEQRSKGGLLKKPDPKSTAGEELFAKFKEASKLVNAKQKEYDDLKTIVDAAVEKSKVVSEEGSKEEALKAAAAGLTVEELRIQNKKIEDDLAAQAAQDQSVVADQNLLNNYTQFRDTLADPANKQLLIDVQKDLKKNFPSYYKGGTSGLTDWVKTQAAIEAIYTARGNLPTNLRGTDLRTFIASPTIPGFGSATGTGTGNVPTINVSDPTEAAYFVRSVFRSVLERDPTTDEIEKFSNVLNKAERKSPKRTVNGVTTGGLGSPTEFLIQEVQKLPEFATKKKDKESLTNQSLQSIAKANGVTLSVDQLANYANEISNGKDINVIKNTIRNSAGLGMPDNIKKMLADGTDLETIYAPYRNTMASLLELDPKSIDINDTTLRTAIGDKELPIYEFRRILKKDPRWQYTNNARAEVSDKVLRVLQDFGFQG